jgi:ABC-type transport system involved in Fe-S cluster assembly fused permease/ATPase subunit
MLTSIRLGQSHGRGGTDRERFSAQTDRSMRAALGVAKVQAQFSFVIALVEALAVCAIVWIGVLLVDATAISMGTLVFLVLALQNMFKPSRRIVSEWYKVGKLLASVERIVDLLDLEPDVVDAPDAIPAPRSKGPLTFRDVTFAYPGSRGPDRPVLHHLDFEVTPGEVVALVGPSGAGKSTIAQLVPRLYDPDTGAVLLDGVDVRRYTLESLRAQVSLVLQDTLLLSGTVRENIGYGVDAATREEIEVAARSANAHDFIEALPDGYDTVLGERGSTLSGGQRQRIAIARAFVRRAPILVLDEPTTGLDADSTRLVVEALRSLVRGTTTIVISHDEALLRCADRVLEINDGHITSGDPHCAVTPRDESVDLDRTPTTSPQVVQRPPSDPVAPYRSLTDAAVEQLHGLGAALDDRRAWAEARAWARRVAGDARVEAVRVGTVACRPDGGATLRYRVELSGSRVQTLLVDVPPDGRAAVMRPFPADPRLPTLYKAVHRSVARGVLAEAVPGAAGIRRCDVEVVHHPRSGPCVLRYALAPPPKRHPVVFGKVYPDAGAERAAAALRLLRDGLPPHTVAVPAPLAIVPALRMVLTEAIPGRPMLPDLLVATLTDAPPPTAADGWTVRSALAAAGEATAAVHLCAPGSGMPVRDLAREQAAVEAELAQVAKVWPGAAGALRLGLATARQASADPGTVVLAHGDLTPGQLLFSVIGAGIVDADTLCRAEPALDLGRFLAYLHVLGVRHAGTAAWPLLATLTAVFLDAYAAAAPEAVPLDRVSAYRALTLARIGASACRQLKDGRLRDAAAALKAGHRWQGGSG